MKKLTISLVAATLTMACSTVFGAGRLDFTGLTSTDYIRAYDDESFAMYLEKGGAYKDPSKEASSAVVLLLLEKEEGTPPVSAIMEKLLFNCNQQTVRTVVYGYRESAGNWIVRPEAEALKDATPEKYEFGTAVGDLGKALCE